MSTRQYRSKLRESQARDTRQLIRESARELFANDGFVSTTVSAIAERAGVSTQTIYAAFGSKGGIIASILEDLEVDAELEAWVATILGEEDPHRQIRYFTGWIRTLFERAAPVLRATVTARGDPDVAALAEQGDANRRAGTDQLAALLDSKGALRSGIDARDAAERLWLLTNPEQYLYATETLGWSPDAYETWMGELLDRELLDSA